LPKATELLFGINLALQIYTLHLGNMNVVYMIMKAIVIFY